MSRRAAALIACLALLVPAAAAVAKDPAELPPLAADLRTCREDGPGARTATWAASMPRGSRGGRLALKFVLLERTPPEARDHRVPVASAERWVRSDPGVAGLVHERRVRALRDPSAYRMEVRFRWYDARGRLERTAVRHSRACAPA